MFINFARTLFEFLVADEFSYIKRADDRLDYETEALSLYKDKGSVLYIVTIIDAQTLTPESYDKLISGFSKLFSNENRAQLILMNVLVNDRERLLERNEDYLPEKRSYIFSYNVDTENAALSCPENQPPLLRMEERIREALSRMDEKYVNGTSLTALENEISQKTCLAEKSDNIYLTLFLIALNIILWLLMELSGGSSNTWTLVSFGAVSQNLVINLNQYYRLFTAIFLHIGIAHLANNCLALYIFGSRVERHFGKLVFLLIYFLSGIIGNIVTVLFLSNLSAGASGGIFGLLGALLCVAYRTGRSVSDLSPYLILLLCISSIGFGFLSPAVNNYAHVAGFAAGVVLGRITFRRG